MRLLRLFFVIAFFIQSIGAADQVSMDPLEEQPHVMTSPNYDAYYVQIWEIIREIARLDVQDIDVKLMPQVQNLDDNGVAVLMLYCHGHKHALDLAYELHARPKLYELIMQMHTEIAAMPAVNIPVIGNVCMTPVDCYVVAKTTWWWLNRQDLAADYEARYSRALTIIFKNAHVPVSGNLLWSWTLDIKKIMDEGTDTQVSLYVTSEHARLDAIMQVLEQKLVLRHAK